MTKKARQRTLPEQLREHRVASTTTEIANLRIDMVGVDLLVTDRSLPASLPTLPTEVLHP
ncbi:hypothetical protein FBF34_10385 [Arachnia propionica]|uniref:Uncharacterized protein n=1 Tax=Arachnia propionica TaxID=1750 RepID=A0AB37I7T2_9ACTN|nr:hypothetical protein [Arachnia propionica]QCT38331.1 hypothetical protein FBF34_10385 [Arachnia propionica]QUC12079.1 hypothetical protein J5A53_05165 [Arachnia propionica]QUC13250.1 hypothetical protein J5A61_10240 [Arachnia propionica]RPA18886.1 hypothetical protein EGT56_13605 [Arachnia propionica]VEJ59168.1 Uncharacterised protein [Arachnia propionica]